MKILDIMHDIKVVSPGITVKEAADIMSKEEIGCLVVITGSKVSGIVTERDILRNITRVKEKIDKIMSKNVITVEDSDTIDRAAEIMADSKIKRLPVTRDGKLVGIVTVTDIIANSKDINENFLLE
jgi:CBS domain-containing protein